MANKIIYWIDDNTGRMYNVVQGIISKFWKLDSEEKGIASQIIIFGNASRMLDPKALWTEEDEVEFNEKIIDHFKDQCDDVDATDTTKETFQNNKGLINGGPARILYKQECPAEEKEFYQSILDIWRKEELEDNSSDEYKKAQSLVSEFIEQLAIPAEAGVGIDLELINGDFRDNSVMKRILSMELYHQLKNGNYKCFLYSTAAAIDSITKDWKEKYYALYDVEGKDEIKIYDRSDMTKKGSDVAVKEIEKMMMQ